MNKKLTTKLVILTLFLTMLYVNTTAYANQSETKSYKNYQYKIVGKTIEITGYKGKDSKLVIPDKIAGKKVAYIGVSAFKGNSKLKSVVLPKTVKNIKKRAFFNCTKLKKIYVPASVKTIGGYALGYKSGLKTVSGFKISGDGKSAAFDYAGYNGMTFDLNNYRTDIIGAERLKSDQSNLYWNETSGANGYVIYRANQDESKYKKIATATGSYYEDESIKAGEKYSYKIKPYKVISGKKVYGDLSEAVESEWQKYDYVTFEDVKRNKSDMSEKQGVYYEIFVRSFADSDGNGVGDFNGVTSKLDYLKELGIDGIWLMPINKCSSYHGYDIDDYTLLNDEYGTEEDFARLIDEAHKRDIKIIMDFVINHTGENNKWFQDAKSNIFSPYRDYFRFVSKYDYANYDEWDYSPVGCECWYPAGNYYYYSTFYGIMPDLNYNNKAVREEIKSAAGKWLNMGVDGFRMDAAMHIYGDYEFNSMSYEERNAANMQWWNEFAAYCEEIRPDVYLVGEAWQDDEVLPQYTQPFDTKFDFAFEQNMMQSVKSETAKTQNGLNLSAYLTEILNEYNKYDTQYLDGVFGTNHDMDRIMSQVDGNVKKAELIANIYLTLSGNPYIYYGEELGMKGTGDDKYKRTPFIWSVTDTGSNTNWISNIQNRDIKPLDEQMTDETSMYQYYKNMIALRKSHKALYAGSYTALDVENTSVMAYERSCDDETITVLHNFSNEPVSVSLENVKGENVLFANEGYEVNENTVTVPATGSVIIRK